MAVAFHDDTAAAVPGETVRDDVEAPHETVIRLDDGRVVRGAACRWLLERTAERLTTPP